jgi:hypothetical protein
LNRGQDSKETKSRRDEKNGNHNKL